MPIHLEKQYAPLERPIEARVKRITESGEGLLLLAGQPRITMRLISSKETLRQCAFLYETRMNRLDTICFEAIAPRLALCRDNAFL